jgi:hypothetical protein
MAFDFRIQWLRIGVSDVRQPAQVTGGWPTYYPRKKRVVVPEVIAEPAEVVTARLIKRQNEIAARLALAKQERRSKAITEQLRAIYAEQDALTAGIQYVEQQLEINDEEESLVLLLAS